MSYAPLVAVVVLDLDLAAEEADDYAGEVPAGVHGGPEDRYREPRERAGRAGGAGLPWLRSLCLLRWLFCMHL